MTVEVQEVDDISHHCWWFFSLFKGTVDDEISPEASWFLDVGKFRCEVRSIFWVGEGSRSSRSARSVLCPFVQVMTKDQRLSRTPYEGGLT